MKPYTITLTPTEDLAMQYAAASAQVWAVAGAGLGLTGEQINQLFEDASTL